MNNDLISREDLRKAFNKRIYYFNKSGWEEANAIIDNAPTVDVDDYERAYNNGYHLGFMRARERPQGEWIDDNKEDSYYANCSHCGYQIDTHYERGYLNYCPNCGADMRKEEENEGTRII